MVLEKQVVNVDMKLTRLWTSIEDIKRKLEERITKVDEKADLLDGLWPLYG
ncbi:hypothetical protein DPMN_145775 [Dreissena polymorpha]|uniref:Uncharacterized protein n=1 Tax=Dreissena polymorpha TaxID=45954 RepID=A0A9D4F7E3_DREPO|nr:hypothetical protein DPMN_145775 [Dreissena polymorpha]